MEYTEYQQKVLESLSCSCNYADNSRTVHSAQQVTVDASIDSLCNFSLANRLK